MLFAVFYGFCFNVCACVCVCARVCQHDVSLGSPSYACSLSLAVAASVNERGGAGAGPDGDMAGSGSPHYSLRWNNHQSHILHAFDTLLQSEALVDVTLVCEDTRRVRAHKVVLSACR